ncbi:variant SH3 domain-containing protein [Microdochium nivale]|nr:variant SH3 domain-containing protein [Microdochium nivale]
MTRIPRHDHLPKRHNDEGHQEYARATIVETVFFTVSPTGGQVVTGWTTVTAGQNDAPVPTTTPRPPNNPPNPQNPQTKTQPLQAAAEESTIAAVAPPVSNPGSIVPTRTTGLDSTLAIATNVPTKTPGSFDAGGSNGSGPINSGSNIVAVPTASSTNVTNGAATSSEDSSAGAKAGIAFGVLGGLLAIGLVIFFLISKRKKKQAEQQRLDNEKANAQSSRRPLSAASMASVMTSRTSPNAPRLSLRPVTQFMPAFGERRSSKGAQLALTVSPGATNEKSAGGSLWERPVTSHGHGVENPFADPKTRPVTPTGPLPSPNPFDAPENVVGVATSTCSPPRDAPAATNLAAAPGVGLARKASTRQEAPPPLDLTRSFAATGPVPPSPAGTEFSMHSIGPDQSPGPSQSAAAIAADGGPTGSAVYRVQLDFAPSLEDELDIRAGQLVRMLHEYDDGWALCIKLDRSHQGVVPRTCLSTRPVKPRPAPGARPGPPVNPNGQRGPPRGPPGPGQRPMTPQGRPMTPQGGPGQMRPQSPANGGPMSPNGMGTRNSPPGVSPMNPQAAVGQKAVPGQAY